MKQLIILSGADRVGKSTLASKMEKAGVCRVIHHGPPPPDRPLFSDLRDDIADWLDSGEPQMVWDRAYVCSYCLNQPNVLEAILKFEVDHADLHVRHIGVWASWRDVARRHLAEIEEWGVGDPIVEYRTRMEEHRTYYERLRDFYANVTLFPHEWANS
jgi:hypothetical protein